MSEALIVSTARTPIGRARKGSLAQIDAFTLGEVAVEAALKRSGVPVDEVDDLVLAESYQGGGVIGRNVAVRLGLTSVPAVALNRHCASGLSAVASAAASVMAGMDRMVLAGGTESLSTAPATSKPGPDGAWGMWRSEPSPDSPEAPAFDMAVTVGENTAHHAGLTRRDVDEWAVYSQQRAAESIDGGYFVDQIVPVAVTRPDGSTYAFSIDEHPRRDTTLESLAALPVLRPDRPDATVTAGNAAGLNDAAAVVGVASSDFAAAHGLAPLARVRSWASVALEPRLTGMGPAVAIPKALQRAGLSLADIDLFEINEAFCSVPVAVVRELGIDASLVNVNGSGASLGHPIAATGARMIVTMVHELRRRGATLGCVSMCAAGGMGSAMVVELL
ncbi:MAG: acetyl-CoA C-acyltransferase [Actinobacteria bacterium]|uniref:Unannotated protein n=1 Tax=freshwater metagenome TaxID=449393 RepID=A0A6J6NKJ1_9ZZZZ|nr:acetyl-CoA C-acyltransferase [Actinomycetota bacterium]